MTIHGFKKHDQPPGYYNTGLTKDDFRQAMLGRGWMSISQVAALLTEKISPTSAIRQLKMRGRGQGPPTQALVARGRRDVTSRFLLRSSKRGRILKKGIGKNSRYKWNSSK